MDRLIYLAMSGAKATLQRQDQLANNLANASTNGFRAELQAFRAVPVRGDGASTRVYALESSVGHDPRSGPVQTTGRALDVALQGAAWLAVQVLDGTEAYTRTGALQVGTDGQLVTPAGLPVLGDGGPITLPANAAVDVASDGTLTTRVGTAAGGRAGRLQRQPGGDHGGDDRRGAPVRAADEGAAGRRAARAGGVTPAFAAVMDARRRRAAGPLFRGLVRCSPIQHRNTTRRTRRP